MAYVVGEPCVNCKYGDCVDACPVDCFYQTDDTLYINPAECIDCDACKPECPVDAIFVEDEDPLYDETQCKHVAPYYIWMAKNFEYGDDTRVTDKTEVEHGPDWDPEVAG
ncbi:MAG: ferredoxin family protein [Myxococcota bacterium]|nr:ferredoxin family protein [Myxococcota bacterium]